MLSWLEHQYADQMKDFYLKLSLYKSVAGQPSKGFDGNENIFIKSLCPIIVKLRSVFLEWKSVVETMWDVPNMRLLCTWYVLDMHLICTWFALDLHLISTQYAHDPDKIQKCV